MREIIFDTETTGLDPKSGDRLVEIGCIEMINRIPTGQTYHAYFNPERSMPAEAEAIHGLSDAFLADKPLFAEHAQALLDFLMDSPLVAHNAGFDFGFLNTELDRCGLGPVSRERMVDTVAMARMRHPGAKNSLDALCTRYGIDRSHRTRHGALLDAELLAQVYVELTGGRQIGLELVAEVSLSVVKGSAAVRQNLRFRAPRPHRPSDEERAAHVEFLRTVQSPLWGGQSSLKRSTIQMDIRVSGHQVDTGESLQAHANERLGVIVDKYFSRALSSNVTFGRAPAGAFRCDIIMHVMHNLVLKATGIAQDAHLALDQASEKIDKQLRRYKRRLKDRHEQTAHAQAQEDAAYTIFEESPVEDDEVQTEAPVVIAETRVDIPEATVSDAVMMLDLRDTVALFFKNAGTGRHNMVYRRGDGSIGWVEPS